MFSSFKISTHSKRFLYLDAKTLLSNENKEKCMQKFQGMQVKQGSKQIVKRAAVLIPIYNKGDEVSLVYTQRAANLRTHRGQVSFPGGKADLTDISLQHTAIRETTEELGISPEDIELWGNGNMIVRQDIKILPVVGLIKKDLDLSKLQLNPKEVEKVFTVNVEGLADTRFHSHTQFRGSYTTPTYLGGPHRIWGLTAVMTFMFLKALLPPKSYPYQIRYIPDVVKILAKKS